jgi:cell division protein ZapE
MQHADFIEDPVQQQVIRQLDQLHEAILATNRRELHWRERLKRMMGGRRRELQGMYIWGGVGRGKTLLMDIFFECLPIAEKKRLHFHAFMKLIHDRLDGKGMVQEPLRLIARDLVKDFWVLCLDEFVVTDIGDAMLIGQLLDALFEEGVLLVTTSNSAPQDLYRDGLQRSRFLPAIELLSTRCEVINLDGGQDYRILGLKDANLFRYPHDAVAQAQLLNYLRDHHVMAQEQGEIEINHRQIAYEFRAEDSIWFSFEKLCLTARSRLDYLEIARQFSTLVLTGIRRMDDGNNDVAKRFISLIDVLYDHRVKLVCTAEVAADELYRKGFLVAEFERTVSRLIEMQGQEYLHLSHRID